MELASTGIITVSSAYSAAVTIDRLAAMMQQKGKVFIRIDQQAEAAVVGLDLRPVSHGACSAQRVGTVSEVGRSWVGTRRWSAATCTTSCTKFCNSPRANSWQIKDLHWP